jgi:hypothetical protein
MLKLLVVLAVVVFSVSTASAALFEFRPAGDVTVAEGQPWEVVAGQEIDVELWLTGTETFGISDLYATWDTAELAFSGGTISAAPTGYSSRLNSIATNGVDKIWGFGLSSDTGGIGPGYGEYKVADLIFTVLDPVSPFDTIEDFNMVWDGSTQYIAIDGGFPSFGPIADAAPDVGAVPIPGAVILLGSGLLGLIGIRRRK